MKIENLCIHCMKEKHSADEVCPFCGSDPKSADIPPYHLQPFSILAGKYLLGMAIGEGGFAGYRPVAHGKERGRNLFF